MAAPTEAQATLLDRFGGPLGFGSACLGANDDASSEPIDLTEAFPAGLLWGERRLSTLYINNNGNVSLAEPLADFTPTAFDNLATPVIAPYWADFDSRTAGCGAEEDPGEAQPCDPSSPSENTVWWHVEPGRLVVTWYRMGRYQCDPSARVSVQLIVEPAGCYAAGDFDMTFRHALCEFTSGDASKSEGQTVHAQVGYGGGLSQFEELSASRTPDIARAACQTGDEPGIHRFSVRSGTADQQSCVGAGGSCNTDQAGACARGALSCEPSGLRCAQLVEARDETCDGLDNDCDGQLDETHTCTQGGCIAGNCAPYCSEGLCPSGLVCDGTFCVPRSCRNVACEKGSFCRDGQCVDSCEGVFCPASQTCVAGRCQSLCEKITCDSSCEVCHNGTCAPRCNPGDCDAGYTCVDGHCEESLCLDVTCATGLLCRAGRCEAACTRVRCPRGYACSNGECVSEEVVRMRAVDPGTPRPAPSSSCSMRENPQGVMTTLFMIALAMLLSPTMLLSRRERG